MPRRHLPRLLLLLVSACRTQPPQDNAALYAAIRASDLVRVQSLLDAGASPNSRIVMGPVLERRRQRGRSLPPPLMVAIEQNSAPIVAALLAKGATVNFTDDAGFSPLERAISTGDSAIVREVLGAGALATGPSKFGFPLIFVAVGEGKTAIAPLLLAKGADVNARDGDGRAAAHYVGDLESVYERMRGRSASRVRPGETPLMLAAQRGFVSMVDVLLANGADPNASESDGRTALMLVAEEGLSSGSAEQYSAVARLLLTNHAEVNAHDARGETALMRAQTLAGIGGGRVNLAGMLEAAGARPVQP